MLDFTILTDNFGTYLRGFGNTAYASVLALAGSFLLGTLLAVFRITPVKPLQWIGTAYVEFVRNIPLLLVVYLFFLGLPSIGVVLSPFACGTLGLAVYTAAFIAEAVRAGILSVPKGQMEAARSSGLSYGMTMRLVILPQAVKIVIPPLNNQFINLIKNSSILSVISGFDLMFYADRIASDTYVVFSTYIFAGLFYLLLTLPLSYATGWLERRLARHD
ncbi:amino acid ABC transporter permease [Cohnella nanjingensis]|uniref:Amino acid ABC transporter permease n=1 Tax=Cohnella nanjingensis TaxID=1387779 RepID=A0A7X0RQW7_9BACL|nr:amino acid ABC transporter permease [Cohnella nanjingensis]MBB6671900.1 amino acid ABC transporter permease [Cohnella nanjingensis]